MATTSSSSPVAKGENGSEKESAAAGRRGRHGQGSRSTHGEEGAVKPGQDGQPTTQETQPFLRHIGSLVGPKPADAAVMRLVSELERAGAVTVSGDAVSYPGL